MKIGERAIAVFDSGVGGLTVASAILKKLPHERIYYLGDLLHLPYGSKSKDAILEFTLAAIKFLIDLDIKLLVIACNTATSVALEFIASEIPIPVVGVIEPGARKAISVSRNKRIGVIGTRRTIESGSYRRAINEIDPSIEVFEYATPLLVPIIEEGWKDHPVMDVVLKEYVKPLKLINIDTLVLGCTHYPLIREKVSRLLPGCTVVDSAETTANSVYKIIFSEKMESDKPFENKLMIYLTDYTESFKKIAEVILGKRIGKIEIISLNYQRGKMVYLMK